MFPQQTALLGMLRKTLLVQAGFLTRKRRDEWVDERYKEKAVGLTGSGRFDMLSDAVQDLGAITRMGSLFLLKGETAYIRKANIDTYPYRDGKLEGFSEKVDIFDNYVSLDDKEHLKAEDIFEAVELVGNKKGGAENSLFKKTSYRLKKGFCFAFHLDLETELHDDMVVLGADRSTFVLKVSPDHLVPLHQDTQGHLILLGDTYLPEPIDETMCTFALVSTVTHRNIVKKERSKLFKSKTLHLYEKGTVFIDPKPALLSALDNAQLQQIGYNTYTIQGVNV